MALKFLNKKGWHTGSLRNVENVWKAEQKRDAEQKKLEELRKQIQEERERTEFRRLQEQAGLVPIQERLDFLYESGLSVGKGNSDGFKELQAPTQAAASSSSAAAAAGAASGSKAAVPGALFEDKPHSANDAWRKLHSDPLLLIRQRQQEALSRIKNNPIQMAMIKKSVEDEKKHKEEKKNAKREKKKKRSHSHAEEQPSKVCSDREDASEKDEDRRARNSHSFSECHHRKKSKHNEKNMGGDSDSEVPEKERGKSNQGHHRSYEHERGDHQCFDREHKRGDDRSFGPKRDDHLSFDRERDKHRSFNRERDHRSFDRNRGDIHHRSDRPCMDEVRAPNRHQGYRLKQSAPKLSEEEREARLREMQMDAELHEEQRWKRLKRAAEADAKEAVQAAATSSASGKTFLDAAQKSIFGTDKGGSSTIQESVRRRTYYSQGGSSATEGNAFRR